MKFKENLEGIVAKKKRRTVPYMQARIRMDKDKGNAGRRFAYTRLSARREREGQRPNTRLLRR